MYNSFNPKWMPRDFRSLKMAVEKRSREIAERYGDDLIDLDVINEMYTVYRNAHGEFGCRDLPICDDRDHEKWCFDIAKKYFPYSRLFWNEGCYQTFGVPQFTGDKSVYYLMLKRWISEGAHIEGIGMQFHAFDESEKQQRAIFNPYRAMEIFRLYSEFDLPIHISEVSIPSYSNEKADEEVQAELTRRMFRLWFSQEKIESIVWWNLADGMAYGDENRFHAGLMRNDMSRKPAFHVLDELIHKEWHTEATLETNGEGIAYFRGFYGDYDVKAGEVLEQRRFHKENTGYYGVTAGPMEQKIII
jgi:GH35 family endo-1,4-beta-xylanase